MAYLINMPRKFSEYSDGNGAAGRHDKFFESREYVDLIILFFALSFYFSGLINHRNPIDCCPDRFPEIDMQQDSSLVLLRSYDRDSRPCWRGLRAIKIANPATNSASVADTAVSPEYRMVRKPCVCKGDAPRDQLPRDQTIYPVWKRNF